MEGFDRLPGAVMAATTTDPLASMATAVILWALLPVIILIQAVVLNRAGWKPFRQAIVDAALMVMSVALIVYPVAPIYGRTTALIATLLIPIVVGALVLKLVMRGKRRTVRFGWRRVWVAALLANMASFAVVGPVVAWGTRPIDDCDPTEKTVDVDCAGHDAFGTGPR